MKRTIIGLLAAAPLCATPVDSAAQETTHPMYYVRQEFVRPAEIAAYETETVRWLGDLDEADPATALQWVTVVGPEIGYAYVVPIAGLAGIDAVRRAITTSRPDAAARWSTVGASEQTPIDHIETLVIELRPDLSYLPRRVELDPTLPFRKYHWYYVIPGLEGQFEGIAGQLVDLYERSGVEHGFRIYNLVLGSDLPVFLMVERALDEADYAVRTQRIGEQVGTGADALRGRFLAVSRRVEVMEATTRGDLSYPALSGGTSSDLQDIRDR
ncbi:MAG: hypothetical protein R3195_15815 [Gemmatimonadota bacterium]|nr:hypothetical protein [Gemmatimonadota bacterium]